ncbi:hypothetical protein LSCM1_01539 [Leishmania martiniquensis]|uniref:Uncharacterized protein n=1 Tax=Leishmania martiniquensis TaxID=1580590 RepID=A0A836GT98_9TRYP|nr:hypothetical protein LSCM1_01539 [Leishmania martiniquensis]
MLPELRCRGHRVPVFSQMTQSLVPVVEYISLKNAIVEDALFGHRDTELMMRVNDCGGRDLAKDEVNAEGLEAMLSQMLGCTLLDWSSSAEDCHGTIHRFRGPGKPLDASHSIGQARAALLS